MGRELKRVPMDFDWPLNKIWYGYRNSLCNGECDDCKHYAELKGLKYRKYGCPDFDTDPPVGNGYQLWETTSEGSPISPVFATPEELAEWCEDGATVLGFEKISKEEWLNSFYWQIIDTDTR